MTTPQKTYSTLKTEPHDGLFPLLEIELKGTIAFEKILNIMYEQFNLPYKLIKADIEYFGKANFGKLLLKLEGNADENGKAIQYFKLHKIKNTIVGYA